jgi:hypothetical protein
MRALKYSLILALISSLVGCALYIPKYCPEQTEFVFKFPYVEHISMGCNAECSGLDFAGIPTSTTGSSYIVELTDTLLVGSNQRREHLCAYKDDKAYADIHVATHQRYCGSSPCTDGWIEEGFEYSEDCAERMMFYVYNPGPGMKNVPMWEGALNSTFEIKTNSGWKTIDSYTAPCGVGMRRQPLYPNEVMACSILLRKGDDLVKGRICFGNHCSQEFMTTVNLKALFELEHPWWWKKRQPNPEVGNR